MTGRVIVGAEAFPNQWVESGRTIRQVTCPLCLDTGRELTADGPLGTPCDCTFGAAIAKGSHTQPLPLCRAVCTSHQQQCQLAEGGHAAHPAGHELHVCGGDYATRGHNFYISQEAPA